MYQFINAAFNWKSFAGMGIYVRYKAGPNKITVRRFEGQVVLIDCPDRQLLMVKDANAENGTVPWSIGACSFDEYVDLNMWEPHVAKAFGIQSFMTNYLYTEQSFCPNNRIMGRPKDAPLVVTDSGGFQMVMQKVEYINPLHLVDHYNRNVDIGVVLDVPTMGIVDDKTQKRAGKVQALNTDLMMKNKRADLQLMNVMHGHNEEQRITFREIVERPDITKVCIGGSPDATITSSTDMIAWYMLTGQKYDQYHALGVYQPPSMLPLARLANIPQFEGLVTSDASTALQSANHKMYHKQQEQFGPMCRIMLGDKNNVPSTMSFLPCQCPVCATIKYADVLAVLDSGMIRHMLFLHNVWEIQRFSHVVNDMARETSEKEYRLFTKAVLKNSTDRLKATLQAIDYVEVVGKSGLEEARRRFKASIVPRSIWSSGLTNSLFKEGDEVEKDGEDQEKQEADIAGLSSKVGESNIKMNKRQVYLDEGEYMEMVLKRYSNPNSHTPVAKFVVTADGLEYQKLKTKAKKKGEKKGHSRQKSAQRYSKGSKLGMKDHKVKKRGKKVLSLKEQDKKAAEELI